MNPYERGWQDAEQGSTIKDCPYRRGTGFAIAWRNGWREARAVLDSLETEEI